jgi:hypothetical protein
MVTDFEHELSQPNRCRIPESAFRIKQVLLVFSGLDRRVEPGQGERPCQRLGQALGNDCCQIGLRHGLNCL